MTAKEIFLKEIVLRVALYFVLIWFLVRLLEERSIFFPNRHVQFTPQDIGLPFEDIFIETDDHIKVNGWLIRYSKEAPTLIFFHGNAGNNSNRLDKIAFFYKLGLNVFILDYRGYGKSEGSPHEDNLYRDAVSVYDYISSREDIKKEKIIAYGESLGGAVAVDLATQRPLAALILDSIFTSIADVVRNKMFLIPTILVRTKMDSLSKMRSIKTPKLFIHSPQDEVIPFKLGQKLFQTSPDPKSFLQIHGNHNEGFLESQEIYLNGIRDFLKKFQLI